LPYPVGIVEKAMHDVGFSVHPTKNVKSQVSGLHTPHKHTPTCLDRSWTASNFCSRSPNCLYSEPGCACASLCQFKIQMR
jgi:hypothetical protein